MEPVERVHESSHKGRFFVADQRRASPSPKKKRKRTEEPAQVAEFWAVKRIVEEKRKDGKQYYLIDWEDHPRTGERYKNSWEPAENVTKDAIDDWNLTKAKGKRKQEKRRQDKSTASRSKDPSSSIESQPIRPANQPRAALRISKSPDQGPSKKPRRAGTANSARFQSVLRKPELGSDNEREIKDSYEEDDEKSSEEVRVLVELPRLGDSFDRDAYSKYSLESSQSTQLLPSSQLLSSPQAHPNTQTRFETPRNKKPFIWDEDTQVVIPDSQDLLGSLSYEPGETSSSLEVEKATPFSSVTHIESDLPSSGRSQSLPSAQISHSVPPYISSTGISLEVGSESISTHNSSSIGQPCPSSGVANSNHLLQSAQNVRSQQVEDILYRQLDRSIEETQPAASAGIQFSSQNPTSQFSSSEAIDSRLALRTSPDHIQHTASTKDTGSHSETQPLPPHPGVDTPQSIFESTADSQHETSNSQQVFIEVPDSQILGPEIDRSDSCLHTESSDSKLEATWQAAQIVSQPASALSESLPVQPAEGLRVTQEPISGLSPTRSQLSPLQPFPILQAEHSHHSPRPSILPSIEHAEVISTSAPISQHSSLRPPPITKTMENISVTNLLLQARAKAAAAQAERRASSVYTPTPPPASPGPAVVNQMLPSREEEVGRSVLIPQTAPSPKPSVEIDPGDLELFNDEPVIEHKSQILSLGPNEYIVPLPMVGIVRSVIITDIKNNNRKIRRFLDENSIEPGLIQEMKSLIDRMKLCCSHQWLVEEDSATQEQMSDTWVAKFSTNCSTKCIFVVDLLSELRSHDAHIVILVQPGKMIQIMESILRYRDFGFKRLDQPGASNLGTSSLQISLVPTDFNVTNIAVPSANLVIAFDSTFDRQTPLGKLRVNNSDTLVPLLHLVVSYSAEHLDLCIEKNLKDVDRLISLVILTKQLEQKAGILPLEYIGPDEAGKAVAKYLLANGDQPWPLLPMPFIEELVDFESESSQEEIDIKATEVSSSISPPNKALSRTGSPPPGSKRALGAGDDSEITKRPRLSPADSEQTNDIEMNGPEPMSNSSSGKPSETINDVEDKDLLLSLMKKVTQLELELQSKEASEQSLREAKQNLEAQVADFEVSNQRILPRYQEALNDRGEAQHNMRLALERERSAKLKADRLAEDLAKLREAKSLVDSKLANATAALVNSSIPAVAEMEKLKADLLAAKIENAALLRRLENTQGTVNYMQENYQTASSAATAAANEVAELQEEIGRIKIYANNNIVEINKINTTSNLQEQLNRIDELTTQKAEVEQQLERKSEELRSMLNGRRPTRGTSVPRSPRMNNTMSPRNRVLGSSSRGNSPAPGDVFGSNRNTFGDALLFPSSGPSVAGRWGQHLS